MPDPRRPSATPDPDPDAGLAPENRNASQDDAPDQAQSLADEALGRAPLADAEDSERVRSTGVDLADASGSTPDVVDHMNQMVRDGRIDMGAYRGERMDDDVEHGLGPQGLEDDFPRGIE